MVKTDLKSEVELQENDPGPPSNPLLLPIFDFQVLSLLAAGSIFACLARLGLTALFTAPVQAEQVFPLVWVQGTGCFLYGLIVRKQKQFEAFWPALYVALRVGFAGGIATFATWQLQSFQAFSNFQGVDQPGIKYATTGLSQLFTTVCTTFFSLHFGRHVGDHLGDFRHRIKPIKPLLANLISVAAMGCWLAALLIFLLTSDYYSRGRNEILKLYMKDI